MLAEPNLCPGCKQRDSLNATLAKRIDELEHELNRQDLYGPEQTKRIADDDGKVVAIRSRLRENNTRDDLAR